jgi:hypothetical protein
VRQMVHDAMADARGILRDVVNDVRADSQLSDDEVLAQYERVRGDPLGVLEFTAMQTGLGGPALLSEATRYEGEMERLWADRMTQQGGV